MPSVSVIICFMAIENMLNDTERREKLLLRSESKNELQEALVLHHRQDSSCSWLHGDDRLDSVPACLGISRKREFSMIDE